MKNLRRITWTVLLSFFMISVFFPGAAFPEQAIISTGGGTLNVRQEESTRSKLITRLQNGTLVEADKVGDEWTHIISGKVEGYVQTKYLRLSGQITGKDVYSNGDTLYVREAPDDESKILSVVSCREPVHVISTENGWSMVSAGNIRGYIRYEKISEQNDQATQPANAVLTQGILLKKQAVYSQPDKKSKVITTLPKKWSAAAIQYDNKWCMVYVDGEYGYVPSSAIQMTGADIVNEKADAMNINDYTAAYYNGKAPSKNLSLYASPTDDLQNVWLTVDLSEDEAFKVLQRDYEYEGKQWARIWLNDGTIGWIPVDGVTFSSEMSTYHYANPISRGATATAYVGENGAKVYEGTSARTKTIGTIPAGNEVLVSIGDAFSGVTYQGLHGWISNNDITFGFAISGNWQEESTDSASAPAVTPRPAADDTVFISAETAKSKAISALRKKYSKFNESNLICSHDTYGSSLWGIKGPLDFFVFSRKDGKYMYGVMIDSITGETLYTEDYTSFGTESKADVPATRKPDPTATPLPDYAISASQARSIADSALASAYGDFAGAPVTSVRCDAYAWKPGYEGPFWQLDYIDTDGNCIFMCMVQCNTGNVIYINDTWDASLTEIDYSDPVPTEEPPQGEIMSQEAAKDIGDRYLRAKYPLFTSARIERVESFFREEGKHGPFYQFEYYEEGEISSTYSVEVNAVSGEIEYSFGGMPDEANG